MRFFDKYYNSLGLRPGANEAEIKHAYRSLAKLYHPDRSGDPSTRNKFIEVNEAYEVLLHKEAYIKDAIRRFKHKQAKKKYGSQQGSGARQRAASYANMRFKEFEKTPIYKTAVVVNSAFNYVFLFLGIIMIISPFVKYYYDLQSPVSPAGGPVFQVLPIFMGVAFTLGIWYFIFKKKEA